MTDIGLSIVDDRGAAQKLHSVKADLPKQEIKKAGMSNYSRSPPFAFFTDFDWLSASLDLPRKFKISGLTSSACVQMTACGPFLMTTSWLSLIS